MQTENLISLKADGIQNISQRIRLIVLSMTLIAMTIIVANFYQADAISSRSSVLPAYILFFILIYLACLLVEYLSLWCERGKNFHCYRIAIHGLALLFVTYEVSIFYAADQNIYSNLSTYSMTSLLPTTAVLPSVVDKAGVKALTF